MTKLNRKISTARKLRQPRKKLRLRQQVRPTAVKPPTSKPRDIGTSSKLEKTGGQSTFVAKNSTEDAKIEFQQVLPGPSWLPRRIREFWRHFSAMRRSYPRHVVSFIAVSSFVLIGMLVSGGWLALKGRIGKPTERPIPLAAEKDVDSNPGAIARSKSDEAIKSVKEFISAKTVEDKLKAVRLPELVGSEIQELFRDPAEWSKIVPIEIGPNPMFSSFHLLGADTNVLRIVNGGDVSLLYFATSPDGRQLIDWDATTQRFKGKFADFREKRSTQPKRFRLIISPDNYYNYGFSEDEYYSIRTAHVSKPDKKLYTYVKKNSQAERALFELYPAIGNYFGEICVYAELRYHPDSQSPDHLEFVSLVYPGWILPDSFYEE